MTTHEQRVADEARELNERMGRLGAFMNGGIYPSLPADDQALLDIQLQVMSAYYAVLQQRLARLAAAAGTHALGSVFPQPPTSQVEILSGNQL